MAEIKWQDWVNQLGDVAVNFIKQKANVSENYNPNIVPTEPKPIQPDFTQYLPFILGFGLLAILLIKR